MSGPPSPRTPREWIDWCAARFEEAGLHFGHGTESARDESAWLVYQVLGLSHEDGNEAPEVPVSERLRARIVELAERRIRERIPMAYLVNEAWFCGLPFHVDERVVIPRSPIAELIEDRFAPWITEEGVRRILDLGTGSACIAVACALAFPGAAVDAVDLDEGALSIADRNVRRHGLAARVACIRSDLYAALAGRRYDLIVANPPYVPAASYAALPREYGHEPRHGLEAGGDGLAVVRRVIDGAVLHLADRGVLVGEVGEAADALAAAYADLPFTWLELERGGEGVFLLNRADLP